MIKISLANDASPAIVLKSKAFVSEQSVRLFRESTCHHYHQDHHQVHHKCHHHYHPHHHHLISSALPPSSQSVPRVAILDVAMFNVAKDNDYTDDIEIAIIIIAIIIYHHHHLIHDIRLKSSDLCILTQDVAKLSRFHLRTEMSTEE